MNTTRHFIPQLSTLFDEILSKDFVNIGHEITKNFINYLPAVNIKETDDLYAIELAAPGLDKSDFNIELHKNILTISTLREDKTSDVTQEKDDYIRREFNYRSFSRRFTLPDVKFDTKNLKANYKNGVLHVSILKDKKEKDISSFKINVS